MLKKENSVENKNMGTRFAEYEKYLTFNISNQIHCIELSSVSEMIAIREIKEVPFMPKYVSGVINLKGKIIPIIDLRLQFDMREKNYSDWIFIIIVNVRNTFVGLKVDSVLNIVSLNDSEIETLPHFNNSVMGIGKVKDSSKILLNAEEILPQRELTIINDNIESGIRPLMK
jgi:purine-binding chemotaxis protein CheW